MFELKFKKIFLLLSTSLIVITFNSYIYSPLTHMTTANIFPGIAPHLNLGKPYLDYWDVYPPGIYLFYYLLYFIFQDSMIGYTITHFILLTSTIYFSYSLLKFLNKNNYLFYLGLLYFLSPLYINYIMVNDLIALFFSYLGLFCFIKFKDKKKFLFSNFFLFFSVFIKETFIFAAFSILIYQLLTKDYKNIKYSFLGCIGSLSTILIYTSYLSITRFLINSYSNKFLLFNVQEIIFKALLITFSILFLYKLSKVLIKFEFKTIINSDTAAIYIYSILLLISFSIIGKDDGGHFDIPKIFTTFFLLSIFLNLKIKKISFLIILIISGLYLKANHSIYSYKLINIEIQNEIVSKNKVINEDVQKILINSDNDVMYLYGWGSTSFFYNYEIKPYTSYWLIHPQILSENQINSLKLSIKSRPPMYIIYCGFNENCRTGFDFKDFEKNYIDFNKIVTKCYTKVDSKVFKLNTKTCLNNVEF